MYISLFKNRAALYNKNSGQVGGHEIESSLSYEGGGTIEGGSGTIRLTERQDELISIIKDNSKISTRELDKILNINHSAVQKHINNLKAKGVISRIGGTRGEWIILK